MKTIVFFGLSGVLIAGSTNPKLRQLKIGVRQADNIAERCGDDVGQ